MKSNALVFAAACAALALNATPGVANFLDNQNEAAENQPLANRNFRSVFCECFSDDRSSGNYGPFPTSAHWKCKTFSMYELPAKYWNGAD